MREKKTEATTEVHIPTAAPREALCVSSAVWAEASNPVIVYCAISSPSPRTNQKAGFEKDVVLPPKPELLTVSVKT